MIRPADADAPRGATPWLARVWIFVAVIAVGAAMTLWVRQGPDGSVPPAPQGIASASSNAQPTPAKSPAPEGTAPAGMVWIPGGEFSMGTEDPTDMVCGGHDPMPDARPVHQIGRAHV